MRRRTWVRLAMPLVIALFLSASAVGQLVQVGPGFVRAPFVRIQKGHDGSTHVQAPFVNVHTYAGPQMGPGSHVPRTSRGRFEYQQPFGTSRAQFRPDPAAACDSLAYQLSRYPTGAYWTSQMQLAWIRHTAPTLVPGRLTPEAAEQVAQITSEFDRIAQVPELAIISRLGSFRVVHDWLRELANPTVESEVRSQQGRYQTEQPIELLSPLEELPGPSPNAP